MGDERTITYDRLIKLDPLADVSPSHVLTIWLRDEKHIVSVDISRSALVSLEHRMSGLEHHRPDPVLLAGLRRMEASLASGMVLDEIQSITFMSQDVDEVGPGHPRIPPMRLAERHGWSAPLQSSG